MSRALFCLIALSVGITGCQKTKLGSSAKPAAPTSNVTPVSNPPPTFNPPPLPPPPPAVPTDETGGVIHQPPVPPPVPPPVRPNPPPPTFNPPPVTHNPPPPVSNPPPVNNPPPPAPVNPPPVTFNEPPPAPVQPPPAPVTPPPVKWTEAPPAQPNPPVSNTSPQPVKPPTVNFNEPAPTPPAKVNPPTVNFQEPDPKHREPIDGKCEPRPVTESKTVTKESDLDILFVVDTSPSFRKGPQDSSQGGDLARLAADMPNFVRQLPNGTNYRIGVMTGNGPESKWHGRLVGGDEPAVLDSKKLSEAELGRLLRNKMKNIPDDRAPGARFLSDSQGEGMLLALYDSITDASLRAQIQKQGLFRKNAALAIIVVSDEQDICYVYPEDTAKYRALDQGKFDQGLVPVLKPYEEKDGKKVLEPDRKEIAAFRFCKTKNGETLNSGHVAQALESLSAATGTKVIMNSITYLSNQGLKSIDGSQAEFEMGHGILDLVEKIGNGTKANMFDVRKGGKVSFANALSSLGATTSIQMRIKTVWDCYSNVNPKAIDDQSLEVSILQATPDELKSGKLDSNGQVITRLSARDGGLKVEKFGGKNPYMRVRPADPVAFNKFMTENKVESAKQQITFKTLRDVDPATGKKD